MLGMMMHRDLRIIDILTFAAEAWPDQGLVSVMEDGGLHRQSYPETLDRVAQLAQALSALGIAEGDRVATLAWNSHRHFELYYGITAIGAVCHTLNPRLSREQLIYMIHHAGDRVICVDPDLVPLLEEMREELPAGLRLIVLCDAGEVPQSTFELMCYEALLAPQGTAYDWPEWPENTAAGLCYTSGTTGDPKGALYSHRSTVFHAMMVPLGFTHSLKAGRKVLPVVPLFHVNAWGLPHVAPLAGMTMVMPGRHLDGESLYALMQAEGVWSAWGVPTVWAGLLATIREKGAPPDGFGDLVVGGAAAPASMIAAFEAMGVHVNQVWGMTEMSPVGTRGVLPPHLQGLEPEAVIEAKRGAGRRLFGVEFKIVDDAGTRLPHDGEATGELYVRGNGIIAGYFNNDDATAKAMDADGWFGTGDVATVEPDGMLVIRDRAKDLVKSGGEWISSIDLENAAVAHPEIAACAVIAVPHPKWDERPVLVAVAAGDRKLTLEEVRAHLAPEFAKWQLPDDVIYVEALPLTATGKISKLTLRRDLAEYVLPELR
ncbi:fatty-acid--CoA ligase [Roseovarius faecimaris]|uniref:Fatty-acid--CoA ligase n=1 Tax=Roseovarius faecimaris TaxID=2494550 RepID=A0A6I6IUQ5_9RHOB|nr:long-chain fatty acid--CoA ligase [Roseovarius faecimaris]QGX99942.1 fatty-acid--CoA ligase [Roseovarius faecimaris]